MENRVDQVFKKIEQYLENIIDYIGDPVFVKDEQSKILLVNDAFCNIFNLSKKDIIGRTLAEDVSPPEKESFLKIDKQVLATGIENENEETLTVRGGETRIISTKKTRFIDESGNKFLIGVIRDITEQKNNEEKIKDSEEKYRSLIEQASDGIAITDQQGNFLEVNESYCRLLGYTKDEFKHITLIDIIPQEDIVKNPPQIQQLIAGKNLIYERRMKRKDGTIFIAEVNSKMAANGTLIGFLRDISERKKTEMILEGEKAMLEMMAKGNSLNEILNAVVLNYEAVSEQAICSILILTKDGKRLINGAAPSLPEAFINAINNEPIGPVAGSCGTAAYRKAAVVVTDIATDPLWINYKELALSFGLKACWSTPIINNKKEVMATFAIYYKESRLPLQEDMKLIERTSNQVKIVLESHYREIQLKESENRLRTILQNEPECVKLLDKTGAVIEMNPAGLRMIEADNLEMIKGKKVLQIINEPYRMAFADLTKKIFEGGSGKLEFEITGLKGASRFLETNAVPLRDQEGVIINLLGVTRDVTNRKKAEKKITLLNTELEQRVKERTKELETTNQELQEVNDLFVGREARIIELKEELETLKNSIGVKYKKD